MTTAEFQERRDHDRIEFRTVCACGETSPWTTVAGMAHGWIADHKERNHDA